MSTAFQRTATLTAALVFAAGATAFASVSIEPSNSITLQPRVRGMGGDPDRETVTITAISHSGKVQITENTCRGGLADVSGVKAGLSESSGSGRPSENEYYATLRLQTKSQEGTCVVAFSDGGHTATVHVRIAKP
jgi:hypothetical protein